MTIDMQDTFFMGYRKENEKYIINKCHEIFQGMLL